MIFDPVFPQIDLYVKTALLAENGEESVRPERVLQEPFVAPVMDVDDEEVIPEMDILSRWQELLDLSQSDILQSLIHVCNLG